MRWITLIAAVLMVASAAEAQTQITRDPVQIELCLCLERAISTRGAEMERRKSAFERLQAQIAAQRQATDRDRDQVDSTNEAAVNAFRIRVETIQEQEDELWQTYQPALVEAIAVYTERTEMFGRECIGRQFDRDVMQRVRARMQCVID